MKQAKIIFVTGTDTGVGKTVFTALLLHFLRVRGVRALAMKPFCSGTRGDVRLLQSLQRGELSDAEANPFYFAEPVAPLVARGARRRKLRLNKVVARVQAVAARCDVLLVEGSGGLLVPLGEGYTVADLLMHLECDSIVVARNRLGTINHTLLTVGALKSGGGKPLAVVVMSTPRRDLSSCTNAKTLAQLLRPVPVWEISSMGRRIGKSGIEKAAAGVAKAVLRRIARLII